MNSNLATEPKYTYAKRQKPVRSDDKVAPYYTNKKQSECTIEKQNNEGTNLAL
jgi:hypothetical protein